MPDYNSPYTGVQVDAAVGKALAITVTPSEINAAVDKVGDITPTAAEINAAVHKVGDITSSAEDIDNTVDIITDNGATDGDVLTATGDGGVEFRTPTAPPVSWSDISDKPSTFPPSEHTHPISDVIGLEGELTDLDERLDDAVADIAAKYTKPSSGIPASDLASAVQTSLGRADSALQSVPSTYRTAAAQDIIDNGKVDKVTGKGLSANDYTNADKTKLAGIEAGAEVNKIDTIAEGANITVTKSGKTVTISASGGGGSNNYNDLSNKPQIAGTTLTGNKTLAELGAASSADLSALSGRVDLIDNGKVDKVSGKGLSTNDYTTADKNKVAAFAALGIPVPTRADAGKVLGVNASGQYALISLLPQHTVTLAGISGTPTAFYVKTPAGDTYYTPGDTITVDDGTTLTCQAYYGPSNNWIKLNGTTVAEGAPAIYNLVVTGDATITLSGSPGSGGQMTIVMG